MAVHDPTPPEPGDLPEPHNDPPSSVFTLPERADWVPQAVRPRPATPTSDDVAGPVAPAVGLHVRRWHLVAAGLVVALALTGIGVIAAGYEPAGRADAMNATEPVMASPTWRPPSWQPPTLIGRPGATLIPQIPDKSNLLRPPAQPVLPGVPGLPGLQTFTPGTGRTSTGPAPVLTPRLVPIPTRAVTPVPTGARTVRFEAWGERGAAIDVSVADSRHSQVVLPARRGPIAFEVALPAQVAPTDFVVVRVQTPLNATVTSRGEVACRVLVGGVVVRSQQGHGYVMCQMSPYYDVRRR